MFIFQQSGNIFPFVKKSEPKGNPKVEQQSTIIQSLLAGNALAKAGTKKSAL